MHSLPMFPALPNEIERRNTRGTKRTQGARVPVPCRWAKPIFIGLLALIVPIAAHTQNAGNPGLLEMARQHHARGHFGEAGHLYRAALESTEIHDEGMRAETLTELADVYVNEERFSKAEAAYAEALGYYRQKADKITGSHS